MTDATTDEAVRRELAGLLERQEAALELIRAAITTTAGAHIEVERDLVAALEESDLSSSAGPAVESRLRQLEERLLVVVRALQEQPSE